MAEERKIKEIREEYASCGEDMRPSFIEEYLADGRPGVSKLIGQAQRRLEKTAAGESAHGETEGV